MLSKCANPACNASFRYFGEGRLFQFELDRPESAGPHLLGEKKPARKVEYFWLCAHCAATLTLSFEPRCKIAVVPLRQKSVQGAAAS
jgi:hypothetical protein